MDFYIILIVITFLLAIIAKRLNFCNYLLAIYLFAVLIFRGRKVGTDTINYINLYYSGYGTPYFSVKNFEFIFIYSLKFLKNITNDPEIVIYFLGFITFLFLLLSFKRFKIKLSYGLLFYILSGIYFFSFNGARQAASISILLYAFYFLISDESYSKWKFIFYILVASGIHISSIYFLFLIFIFKKDINLKISIGIFLFSLIVNLFFAEFISNIISSYLISYYEVYSDELLISNSLSIGGKIFILLLTVSLFGIYILLRGSINPKLLNLFFLSIILILLLKNLHPYISRILYGMTIVQIIIFSRIFANIKLSITIGKKRFKLMVLLTIVSILNLYSILDILDKNIGELIPYYLNFYI